MFRYIALVYRFEFKWDGMLISWVVHMLTTMSLLISKLSLYNA
ncbi:hypothetical protein VCR3J2_250071 [Vibrio coralliirubri]|nr:hypothetical protein VCR3J2_250071 [Vibrio coralliirubri]